VRFDSLQTHSGRLRLIWRQASATSPSPKLFGLLFLSNFHPLSFFMSNLFLRHDSDHQAMKKPGGSDTMHFHTSLMIPMSQIRRRRKRHLALRRKWKANTSTWLKRNSAVAFRRCPVTSRPLLMMSMRHSMDPWVWRHRISTFLLLIFLPVPSSSFVLTEFSKTFSIVQLWRQWRKWKNRLLPPLLRAKTLL
jgi:hypothetical protein